MRTLQFSIRRLLVLTAFIAVMLAALISVHRSLQRTSGKGPLPQERWPSVLKRLAANSPADYGRLRVHGLGRFFDERSVWLIEGDSPVIDKLFTDSPLESVSRSHPMAEELLTSLPRDWPKINPSRCTWRATPGFGTSHIEGLDLFLIMRDEKQNISIVLHHWIF